MKYYKEDDILPTALLLLLSAMSWALIVHHKNETTALRRDIAARDMMIDSANRNVERALVVMRADAAVIKLQGKRIEGYKTILRAMPVQEFRNQKGERI